MNNKHSIEFTFDNVKQPLSWFSRRPITPNTLVIRCQTTQETISSVDEWLEIHPNGRDVCPLCDDYIDVVDQQQLVYRTRRLIPMQSPPKKPLSQQSIRRNSAAQISAIVILAVLIIISLGRAIFITLNFSTTPKDDPNDIINTTVTSTLSPTHMPIQTSIFVSLPVNTTTTIRSTPTMVPTLSAEDAIRKYYQLTSQKVYKDAWQLLSQEFKEQGNHKFSEFEAWWEREGSAQIAELSLIENKDNQVLMHLKLQHINRNLIYTATYELMRDIQRGNPIFDYWLLIWRSKAKIISVN